MSRFTCPVCKLERDLALNAVCPRCLSNLWTSSSTFVKPKHNPYSLPSIYPSYRSVLSFEMVDNIDTFSYYTAASGSVYNDNKYHTYCCYVAEPLGIIPGSAVPALAPLPTNALDGLVVVDAFGKYPHAFAADQVQFHTERLSGRYTPLLRCTTAYCQNLCIPDENYCEEHKPS